MKKYIFTFIALLLVSTPVSASTLTTNQINSIIFLLQAFGVNQTTISTVYTELIGTPDSTTQPQQTLIQPLPISQLPVFGSTVSVPVCKENPVLTVSTTTSVSSSWYDIVGLYATGCPINQQTPVSYYADSWRFSDGTIANTASIDENGPYFDGRIKDSRIESNGWEFWIRQIPSRDGFTVTVGTTTKTI